ncbi:MAG: hypothetical protein KAJ19_11500, partial [Gammaproteobacteria bacterium]|nr:hypothetical protein [Gammaproteobacteria bacterium]
MSRELILNDLVSQLDDLSNVSKATMRLLLFIDQEKYMPYIGVIPGDDIPVISDGYDTRYNMSVTLIVKTREDELPLETLISDIKTLMQSIDLGADVLSSKVVGIQEVDVQDEKSTRFSATGILLEIIYKENFGTDYPAIETRTLTEPDGVAHYKLYETLVSGSVSIQALGTNVYDTHFRAAMEIPAGSGSISIGSIVNAMDEDDDATSGDERIENHMMGFELR